MKILLGATACVATLALATGPVSAQDFCGVLRAVAASVPTKFASVYVAPAGDAPGSTGASAIIPGAVTEAADDGSTIPACAVTKHYQTNVGGPVFDYTCTFSAGADIRVSAATMAAQVGACLGQSMPAAIVDDSDPNSATFEFRSDGVKYEVGYAQGETTFALNLSDANRPAPTHRF